MVRASLFLTSLLVCAFATLPARAEDDWHLDTVHLKNGNDFQGLVDDESTEYVHIRVVRRCPGRPVVVYSAALPRTEVSRIDLAEEKDRELLADRLKSLEAERQSLGTLLRIVDPEQKGKPIPEFNELELSPAKWAKGSADALSYKSSHFRIVSNAPREQIVCTAIQLEQIYTAYAKFLPPREKSAEPTTVLLPQSFADYQGLLKDQGKTFLNWAYYDADRNQIVCPSDLQQISDEWAKKFEANDKELKRLQKELAELKQLFKGSVPASQLKQNRDQQDKLRQLNEQNRKTCEQQLQKVFQPLYHEAFHAYLNNQVFPPADYQVPRWLGEGLAQIFETATLEAGELSVERLDKDRLSRAQTLLRKGEMVSLVNLLKADQKQFLAVHNTDQLTTDRYYVASWALASYLMSQRKMLNSKALEKYVQSLHRGDDPLDAFRVLVDQPLKEFERDFQQSMLQWKP